MNRLVFPLTAVLGLGAACSKTPEDQPPAPHAAEAGSPTNRVAVPAAVRQNLGITFATAERRAVAKTVRVPGRFELLPNAQREYRTMLPGRVELIANQYDRVETGTVLYRLHSARWREIQQQIAEAEAAVGSQQAASETIGPLREAHRVHEKALDETVALWEARVQQLQRLREAGGGMAEELAQARAMLVGARAELAEVLEKDAELEAREREISAQLGASHSRVELLLATASTLVGLPETDLAAHGPDGKARWRSINEVEVRASAAGVVGSLAVTNGSWAEESSLVLTTVQPERLRFHARGLQSDLTHFRDGLPARVAPPSVGGGGGVGVVALQDAMEGTLFVGLTADPDERTVDLYTIPAALKPWARAGVSAYLEVTLEGGEEELAVPLSAISREGVTPILFRRDPKDPDTVIRLEADLGIDDGRWVIVRSGLKLGDEVVLDGVYQLMLATSDSAQKGGHFHSDGTFHEGEDK